MSTGIMSATGKTAIEAKNNLNNKLMKKAGKAHPQGNLAIKRNSDGSYTASVTMKR